MNQFRALQKRLFSHSPSSLSHIGKAPIKYTPDVQISVSQNDHPHLKQLVSVSGPLGKLDLLLPEFVRISMNETDGDLVSKSLSVQVDDVKEKSQRAMWGTSRTLINNMVQGVTEGYIVHIRLEGVGYRASVENDTLTLRLGFSHPVIMKIPEGVDLKVPSPQRILLQGIDKAKLTLFAASIRKWRKPEPYNQKGIFVGDETIKKKEGKKR